MSSVTVPHSISTLSTNGDIDCGRGQLGYTANGSLVGAVNSLWTLTTPHKPHFCTLDCAANSAVQLPIIGTSLSQANLGYRVTILNKSANTIDVQDSAAGSIFVLQPGVSSTFIAVTIPNGWDYTSPSAGSGATLQSAYDAGNTIVETPAREVSIKDDAGHNTNILRVLTDADVPLLNIGNTSLGVDTPYVKQGPGVLSNPRPNTTYNVTSVIPYDSSADDQGRIVSYTSTSNREVFGTAGVGLGNLSSCIVKDTFGSSQNGISSSGVTNFNFVGLPNTTYLVKYDIIIRNPSAFSSVQVNFTMDNLLASNTVTAPYLEIQNSPAVTVDPIITVSSFGTSGYTIGIQGPDYNPPGVKAYTANWIVNSIAYSH